MDTRLLVSLSGIRGSRLAGVIGELDGRDVPVTFLLRPRSCVRTSPLADWVRTRVDHGDGVLMHGYDHSVLTRHPNVLRGRRAEFAGLPAHEAGLRLTAGLAQLELSDLPIDGFAPPRWLSSAGTVAALHRHGFRLCADTTGVHDLRTGVQYRSRVHILSADPGRTEALRCFGFVLTAARAARRGGLVRLGADAADLERPGPRQALLDAVDVALEAGARPTTYGGLIAADVR